MSINTYFAAETRDGDQWVPCYRAVPAGEGWSSEIWGDRKPPVTDFAWISRRDEWAVDMFKAERPS